VSELVRLFDLFDAEGIALVFLDMNIDSSTSQGRLLRHVMAAFAEYESDVKSDYARANYRHAMSQGKAWGGRAPFGYDRDPAAKSYVANQERAEIVRETFSRYRAGQSQYEISKHLNAAGNRRPSGTPWTNQQVGRVLDNLAYAAYCLVEGALVSARWEAIIDRETWHAVQSLRRTKNIVHKQRKLAKAGPYLLTGLIHCGTCGRKLYHRSRARSRNGDYRCVDHTGATRCGGGGVGSARADEFVTQEFLKRARFGVVSDPELDPGSFQSSELAWRQASLEERRRLLSLAMRRVEVLPWPHGIRTRGSHPRQLRIVWVDEAAEADATKVLTFTATRSPLPERHREVSEGRAESLRKHEAEQRDAQRK
jgi:hypothetical protein